MKNNYKTYRVIFKDQVEPTITVVRARTRDEAVRKARKNPDFTRLTLKAVEV